MCYSRTCRMGELGKSLLRPAITFYGVKLRCRQCRDCTQTKRSEACSELTVWDSGSPRVVPGRVTTWELAEM